MKDTRCDEQAAKHERLIQQEKAYEERTNANPTVERVMPVTQPKHHTPVSNGHGDGCD